ncbi:MAG: MvdC/MvdD family ATP grasp protein [Pseudonocardiaceae bacterium]
MTVLILARDINPSADLVVAALGERGVPVFRTDLAAFPQALTVDARLGRHGWDGVLATEHREVRLSEIRSVWYRNPTGFALAEGMSVMERKHAATEARAGLSGVLSSLEVLWVNHPARQSDALKPRQLHTAHLFQRFVQPKAFEARVTVVGSRVFAVAIHARSEAARVDWRADYDALDYAAVEPPEPVTAGMLAFVKYFGLTGVRAGSWGLVSGV